MSKAPAPPKPWVSGFCNPTLPRTEAYDPHQRCRGCDCRAPGCPCNPVQEDTMPRPETDAPAFGWTPLCEQDPNRPEWCAYHRSHCTSEGPGQYEADTAGETLWVAAIEWASDSGMEVETVLADREDLAIALGYARVAEHARNIRPGQHEAWGFLETSPAPPADADPALLRKWYAGWHEDTTDGWVTVTPHPVTRTTDPADEPHDLTPEEVVAALAFDADALNVALTGYGPDDWTDAARLLHALRKVTTTLHALDAGLVNWLYLHGEHGIHLRIEGIPGDVSITRGRKKERWEGEAAARDYVGARIEALGGEMVDPLQVVEWVLEVVPAAKCRVTPLRDAGLEVADYRTSEPGNLQVGLPKAAL